MTVLILLTLVFFGAAIVKFFHEKGVKGKGGVAAVFLAGMFFALASAGVAADIQSSLIEGTNSVGQMVAGFFQ